MILVEGIMYTIENNKRLFSIELFDEDTKERIFVNLKKGNWRTSTVIDALIRTKYSQDRVEAIINNHFLNIADWIDKKFKGEEVAFEDSEYEEFQKWRTLCKNIAPVIIDAIEKTIEEFK